jgi:DNA invertase Pin-like site-specific DNA recombinase
MHILGAIAEFERGRIRERVMAGLHRARMQGKRLGRPRAIVPVEQVRRVEGLSADVAAARLGVSRSTVKRWRRQVASRPVRHPDGGALALPSVVF